jgi:carboxymethylenebutenolidase
MDAVLQVLRLLLIGLVLAALLLLGGLVGLVVADTLFGPRAADSANLTYTSPDGGARYAYLNIPAQTGVYPGIVMLPDRWGLNGQMIRLANRLADAGYVVLVPDLYRGQSTDVLPRALLLSLTLPAERALTDVEQAYDYLTALPQVDAAHIGVVGFGTGGGVALRFAAQTPTLGAVVNAYGPALDAGSLGQLRGPVLGMFAARDPFVSAAQVERFRAALQSRDIPHDVIVYQRLETGFFRYPEVAVVGSAPYNAWLRLVEFLNHHLKPAPASSSDRFPAL